MEQGKQEQNDKKLQRFDAKKQSSFFAVISDFLDCLVVILDERGRIAYYNSFCEAITGSSLDQVKDNYYWDHFCLPEEKELYRAFFASIDIARCPLELESQIIREDGSLVTILWKHNVMQGQDNKIEHHVLTGTDITAYDKSNKALQDIGEKYRTIIHVSPVSVISLDTDFRVKSWSSAAERLLGWTEKDVLDINAFTFLDDSAGTLRKHCAKASEGQISYDIEFICTRKDTSEVVLNLYMAPMRDYSGIVSGVVIIALDVTKRKQAEEKIIYMSFHDQLTGLYNRHFLEEELHRLGTGRQFPLSIIIADLNGLKLVNDTYGHLVGDEMLKTAASILNKSCRKEDLIARWGGDEFIIVLPETTLKDAKAVQDRIAAQCLNAYAGDIPISIALGSASKDNKDTKLSDTLKEAEGNMYKQKLVESRSTRSAVLSTLLKTLAEKSYETEMHTRRMHEVGQKIGSKMGLNDVELNRLNLLITLHDIGKINISEEILTKKGPLTAEEWEVIKKHPEVGYRIARATEEFAHVAEDIAAHHERWDGAGYPQGLKGDEIPLLARITAIADAYEVMSNGRPYKKAMGISEITAEFKKCSGTQFDPALVEIFLSIL